MPSGTSWPRYITAVAGALFSMFAGAQTVHIIYQPLKELNDKVEIEKHKLRHTRAEDTSLSSKSTSSNTTTTGVDTR